MKVSYDKSVDAKYVTFKKGKVFQTKPLNDWLFLDINRKGEVLGVEILDASKNEVALQTDGLNLVAIEIFTKRKEVPQIKFANKLMLGEDSYSILQYA
jgi:uncharacterized protein YuzE